MANYLLIAGYSSIGQVAAKLLLDKGHKVMITGKNIEKTKEIASDLGVGFKIFDAANFYNLDKLME